MLWFKCIPQILCAENIQPDTSIDRWDLYKVFSPKGYVLMSELISLLMGLLSTERKFIIKVGLSIFLLFFQLYQEMTKPEG